MKFGIRSPQGKAKTAVDKKLMNMQSKFGQNQINLLMIS